MACGSEKAVARAQPMYDELGKATTHIGPASADQVATAGNQIVVALTIQAVAGALTLARTAGVDPARVREALLGGVRRGHSAIAMLYEQLSAAADPGPG